MKAMEDKKDKKIHVEEKDLQWVEAEKDREIQSILMKADENKEEIIAFDENDNISFKNEIESLLDTPVENPQEKYDLYYMVIDKILRENLPKGEENKEAREFIYEEKKIFLTRGHRKDARGIRHADSRMGYNPDMKELITVLTDWVVSRGTMFELYTRLRNLNKSKGYPVD